MVAQHNIGGAPVPVTIGARRETMGIVVQKYGGSSVADPARIGQVADRVARTRASGKDLVVVVSAMGDTTDELLALSRAVTDTPPRRELDMLLSAGERISMALLSMALNARGVPAVSFTGSQSGIITNDAHANARILEVRPYRVQDELARGNVVIVAGYQGVSYKKEVTTLGRGGSDTTAVALAAALGAEACEIYSDVAGVYSADPRVVPEALRLAELSYEEMQELARCGARVLNAQAVEFARERGIALYARSTFDSTGETVVRRGAARPVAAVGVAAESGLVLLSVAGPPAALDGILAVLSRRSVPLREMVSLPGPDGVGATVLLSIENVHDFPDLRREVATRGGDAVRIREGIGAVSVVGSGLAESPRSLEAALTALSCAGITVLGLMASAMRLTVVLEDARVADASRALHAAFIGVAAADTTA
jgi:aspartate kinase